MSLLADLGRAVGADHLITDPVALRTYQSDGLTGYRAQPLAVALPGSTAEVVAAVSACERHGVPFVARGAGTGLSGGAVPVAEGIVIGLSRMRAILDVDVPNRRVRLQPGVTNLEVTQAVAPHGLYYAPDPSSQQVCTIGGNVAENSGGAHCLKYGFTTNHVLEADVVLAGGELVRLSDHDGLDLLGAVVGSEGTLGVVTEVVVRVLPRPQRVETLLAAFADTDQAGEAVSAIIAAGIIPAAIEMMDALTIAAAEAAVHAGLPLDAGAVLLIELDGPALEVEQVLAEAVQLCRAAGARDRAPGRQRGRAGGVLAGPQGGVRGDGPDQSPLLRAGRRGAADAAARDAAPDRASCRSSTGCGSATCSTPATATCIRWCCTTRPWRASRRWRRSWPPRS